MSRTSSLYVVLLAGTLLAGGCSSAQPTATSSETSTPERSTTAASTTTFAPVETKALETRDPKDTTFIKTVRSKYVASGIPESSDDVLVVDANAVCHMMQFDVNTKTLYTDLKNQRNTRQYVYGIEESEATEVMMLSAQTYCPRDMDLVESALDGS